MKIPSAGRRLLRVALFCLGAIAPLATIEAQTLTRGPYLQNGNTTAVTVRWRTSAANDSVVRYGTVAGSLTQSVSNAAAVTEHELRLTGLSPNTTYYYSVGSTATTLASGADCFFITAPTAAKPTRVWVLGDAGTGSTAQTQVRDAYYAFTGTRHTDLWLMLGDNTYSNGTDAEYTAKMFNVYPAMMRKSVLWPAYGNHDAGSADSASQTGPYYDQHTLPKAGEAGGVASGTEAYYAFDYGNIHFVVLDSTESSRSATGPMANWLRSDLAANTKDWTVVYWHHPPYSKGSHNSDTETELVEMRTNINPILESYGVDLVLCGHSHSYERSFFLDGHYGASSTFNASTMVKQTGNGRTDGNGAYTKTTVGSIPRSGVVYSVPGSSGQIGGGTLNHPAMFTSLNVLGSVVLDFDGPRLDVKFLDNTGAVRDYYTLTKGGGPANVAPTASITGPAAGATFTAPATVTINANAADSDGTITKVDFYQGATLLGTDTTSPYSFAWTNVAAGSFSLTVKATDNAGAVTTSAAVAITVNAPPGNVAPTVDLTGPAGGATFTAPASVTISANAADSDGTVTKVDFYQGATLLGTDTTSPYSFAWTNVAAGSYSLTAKATDNVGAVTTSAAVAITVNPGSGPTTVSFQDGVNGYAGTRDTTIRSDATTTNYGTTTTLLVDGSPDYASLIKWDLSSIPAGKTVTAVTISLNVVDVTTGTYEIYALKRDWVETGATWAQFASGSAWQTAGANGANDRETTVLGSVTGSSTGVKTYTLNAAGIAKVQSWLNAPATNYGFAILDYAVSDGLDVNSSEFATVASRPKITVTYQ
jgi:hypothetical protein